MTLGWQLYVFLLVVGSLVATFLLLAWTTSYKDEDNVGEDTTTGHVWDGDLTEYNKPLPRWWLYLFHGTIVFSVIYMLFFPGFGIFDGFLDWSREARYEREMAQAEAKYGKVFAAFAAQDIPTLARNEQALSAGVNLFGNNCAQCHGSDGRGAVGFPNLTDGAWLWGGEPAQIEATILRGRNGVMPPWGAALGGEAEVEKVANFVLSLSGQPHDAAKAAEGQAKYQLFCVACHGPAGQGNVALGAPNLADDAWLYAPTLESITETITNGRQNEMPAFAETLGPDRVKVLAGYVYALSRPDPARGTGGEAR